MSDCIEINYNDSSLPNLSEELKCKLVTVIIRADGYCNYNDCCCSQRGYFCEMKHGVIQLINKQKNCNIYIPLDAVAAIILSEQCTSQENNEVEDKKENIADENKDKVKEVKREEELDNSEGEIITEDETMIYGYGRKINIDFLKKRSDFTVTEINITELSTSISSLEKANDFIYYFHKDGINNLAIELLVSPAGPGTINSIAINRARTKAIIKGQGLVYCDDDNRGEYDFKLLITKNRAVIKIIEGDEILEYHSKTLVGVCAQENNPFIIE